MSNYIDSEERFAEYLSAALEEDDPALLLIALRVSYRLLSPQQSPAVQGKD
ncbi:hypothetical protein L1889_06460 [Paenalcaligenes niemegkensis]|uniref:hypothetical protein n=1 Tax=Paenalcaligenes niemegkensis TaxID=2895469 RepID=UPI001EE98159|nr:hypothetical protein [Paenalcaligenes niemegkensis]MCQ9616388.1 hypothetical protein [Paenalcaligenes niemegkensis]